MKILKSGKIKRDFFQTVDATVQLYGCTTLTRRIAKKLDGNYTRMQRTVLKQYPATQKLYSQLPSISKSIQIKRTRQVDNCCRIQDELLGYVLSLSTAHRCASVGLSAKTLCLQKIQPERHERNVEWEGWMVREGQRNSCCLRDLVIRILIMHI